MGLNSGEEVAVALCSLLFLGFFSYLYRESAVLRIFDRSKILASGVVPDSWCDREILQLGFRYSVQRGAVVETRSVSAIWHVSDG